MNFYTKPNKLFEAKDFGGAFEKTNSHAIALDELYTKKFRSISNILTVNRKLFDPDILKSYLRDDISIETLVILDRILGFRKDWNDKLSDPVWETVSMRMKKYSPFLNIDVPRYKKILKEVVVG